MADEGRSVYWPIMVAACIGALGTVAAAVVGKIDAGSMIARGDPVQSTVHGAKTVDRQPNSSLRLPADWIDARGRYYSVRQSGESVGVIAYDGGQRALDKDKVRLTGDGTLNGKMVRWNWARDKAKNPENCVGRASATAIAVRCAREDSADPYDLRLVVR